MLSGGVFQNRRLLEAVAAGLTAAGLRVLTPERLPAGDGGISYGQAAVAARRMAASHGSAAADEPSRTASSSRSSSDRCSSAARTAPFGELTLDDARARADELRAAIGWGPTARVAPVALAWRELAMAMERSAGGDGERARARGGGRAGAAAVGGASGRQLRVLTRAFCACGAWSGRRAL